MNNYSATSARIDITPKKNIPLGGYAKFSRTPYQQVDDNLELNGVMLKYRNNHAVLLSADTLYVTDKIKEKIIQTVNKNYNLIEKELFFASTHTHYTPYLDKDKPHLGLVDTSYELFFINSCIKAIDELFTKKSSEVELIYNECQTDLNINRRKIAWDENYDLNQYVLKVLRKLNLPTLLRAYSSLNKWFFKREMRIFPNPDAITDNNIYSISIRKKDNTLVGVIWSYACHPVCYPNGRNVTSHFPGAARNALRDKINQENLPVVYFQGFSGNIRPTSFEEMNSLKSKILLKLNGYPRFADYSLSSYESWTNRLNQYFINTVISSKGVILNPKIQCTSYKMPLSKMLKMINQKDILITFQSINLGSQYCIFGVSGEPAAEYVLLLKQYFSNFKIIPVGCLSGTFGYIPTSAMIKEGGYESNGFLKPFSLNGKFRNDIQSTFLELSKKVLENFQSNTSLQ